MQRRLDAAEHAVRGGVESLSFAWRGGRWGHLNRAHDNRWNWHL